MTPASRPDAASAFFEDVEARGPSPSLRNITGTIRVDVLDGNETTHWYLTFTKGNLKVSHKSGRADAHIRADKKLFDGMVRGTVNTMAALLRGAIELDGNMMLLNAFDHLLPGPPASQESFIERQKAC
jgi:hypothetical protein